MAKKTTKTGKALERQVADAYRAIGARKVEHDVELAGHQIDVYVEMETADRALHRIAVEAKDYSKAVGIKIVRDFAAVVNTLRGLKLVDEGVIVSSSGFSRQARNAAKEHGLRLLEPADLEAMVKGPDFAQMREGWAEAERRYLDHVIEQHRILSLFITQLYGGKVPPMAELEQIFVCLNLTEGRRGRAEGEVERVIEETYIIGEGPPTEFERRVEKVARREPAVELASVGEAMGRHQRLLVRGAPGCGKTTLLRYVVLKYARGQAAEELGLDEARLPIYLPLRDFGLFLDKRSGDYGPPGPTALAEFIAWYFQQAGLALPEGFFLRALKAKRAVVLLDGLDEVPDPALRTKVAQMTTAFMNHYHDNRYVLASRPRGYAEVAAALPGLPISDVEELSPEQVEEFVHNLYRIIERHGREDEAEVERQATARADEILKAIESNLGIRSLARNPLHLSVIVLVHKYHEATLPERRVDVYRESIAMLLGYWDVRRQVEDPLQLAIYTGTDTAYRDVETAIEEKQALLAPLALWMHEQRKRVVEENLIVAELAARFEEDDALPPRRARAQAKTFLAAAHDRSGILVEGNPRFYNFSHQGFQEYLAAWELVSGNDYIERALAHLYDSWWEEVILLAAAQLPPRRATPLLEAILIAGHDDPQQKALDEVLHRNLFLVARCLADIPHRRVAGKLRRKVIDRLVDMVYSPPLCTAQRKDALQLLVQMRYDPGAEVGLLELLRYGAMDPETRRATAEALTRGPGDADARAVGLLRMAQDREIELWARQAAAGLLARIGHTEEAAIVWLALAEDSALYAWERRRAAETLGQLGEASEAVVSRLLALAEDGSVNAEVRRGAAEALGQLGEASEMVVPRLLSLAEDDSTHAEVRRGAAEALGQLREVERAVGVLLSLAEDGSVDTWNRGGAAGALGQLGEASEMVVSRLLSLAEDGSVNAEVRRGAAQALGQLGEAEKATGVLLSLAEDDSVDGWVRRGAAEALGQLGEASEMMVSRLLSLAEDGSMDPKVRRGAAQALGQLGEAERAVGVLLSLAEDGAVDTWNRGQAAEALGQLGETEKAVGVLLSLAEDGSVDTWNRGQAGEALGQLGETEKVVGVLLSLAEDGAVDADVRSDAAEALGQLGEASEMVVPRLFSLVEDGSVNAKVRRGAVEALGQLGEAERTVDVLLSLVEDGAVDAEVQRGAAQALGQLGEASEAVVSRLLSLAEDGSVNAEVRRGAAEALGQLGEVEKAVGVLLSLAEDGAVDAEVRSGAVEALGQLGEAERAVDVLLSLAEDGAVDAEVRSDAAEALGQLGEAERAVDVLFSLVEDGSVDAVVRGGAAQALGQLGEASEAVVSRLLALAEDGSVNGWVRRGAAEALGQLGEASEMVVSRLLSLAEDSSVDAKVRCGAAEALGQLGEVERAVGVLLSLVEGGSVDTWDRGQAAEALGQLGEASEAVVSRLLALAEDGSVDAEVRRGAAEVLGRLGDVERAAGVLLTLAEDGSVDAWKRGRAAEALGQLGEASEVVVSRLLTLAEDGSVDAWVRGGAAGALGQLKAADATIVSSLLALARVKRPLVPPNIYIGDSWENWLRSVAYRVLQRLLGSERQLGE